MDRSGVTRTGLQHREYGVGCDSGDRDDFAGRVEHGGSRQRRLGIRRTAEQILLSTNSRIRQFFNCHATAVGRGLCLPDPWQP